MLTLLVPSPETGKTAKHHGTTVTEFPYAEFPLLTQLTRRLLRTSLPVLRASRTDTRLFVKADGQPFGYSAEFTNYLNALFKELLGVDHVATNSLRHGFLTFFKLDNPGGNRETLIKSIASCMRHRPEEQAKYAQVPTRVLRRPGVTYGTRLLKQARDLELSDEEEDASAGPPDSSVLPALPTVVGLVSATVPGNNTPTVWFARVDATTAGPEGDEIRGYYLEQTTARSRTYRLTNEVLEDSLQAAVYPIDYRFDAERSVYVIHSCLNWVRNQVKLL